MDAFRSESCRAMNASWVSVSSEQWWVTVAVFVCLVGPAAPLLAGDTDLPLCRVLRLFPRVCIISDRADALSHRADKTSDFFNGRNVHRSPLPVSSTVEMSKLFYQWGGFFRGRKNNNSHALPYCDLRLFAQSGDTVRNCEIFGDLFTGRRLPLHS